MRTVADYYDEIWNPSLVALTAIERRGFALDVDYFRQQEEKANVNLQQEEEILNEWAGKELNWNSPAHQVAPFLYDELKLPIPPICGTLKNVKGTKKNRKGEYIERPTSEAAIFWLRLNAANGHEEGLAAFSQWKKTYRLRGYLRSIPSVLSPVSGRLHTILKPETDTGRLSASKPPLQQIPGNDPYVIRGGFVASPGHKLIVSDYSQLEVYVMAHELITLFGDWSLANALATGDVYSAIAKLCWPHLREIEGSLKHHPDSKVKEYRGLAKIVVLAVNYGKTEEGLTFSLLDETGNPAAAEAAQELLSAYHSAFPSLAQYRVAKAREGEETGGVKTLMGRWRPIPELRSRKRWEWERGERQALNTPIQGGAADLMTCTRIALHNDQKLRGYGAGQVLEIHDEAVLEVPEAQAEKAAARVTEIMEDAGKYLHVPLKAETTVCDRWSEGK